MVFPIQSKDRTMRNLLMLSQDHARLIVEIFRKVLIIIENFIEDDKKMHKEELGEIEKLHSKSLEIRRMMMKELHETGGMLVNREDLYRLFSKSGEVMDHTQGIGVRLWEMEERTWKIPKGVKKGLLRMCEVALETLTKLRESLIILGFDSRQAIVLAREVDEGERKVDTIYRKVDLDIITSEAKLPIILILRDITGMIENIIDKAVEMANFIRIIAL